MYDNTHVLHTRDSNERESDESWSQLHETEKTYVRSRDEKWATMRRSCCSYETRFNEFPITITLLGARSDEEVGFPGRTVFNWLSGPLSYSSYHGSALLGAKLSPSPAKPVAPLELPLLTAGLGKRYISLCVWKSSALVKNSGHAPKDKSMR